MTNSILKTLTITIGLLISSLSYAIDYVYDDLNRLVQVTYPTGEIITYTYDATGNLQSVIQIESNADALNSNEANQ